MTVHALSQNSKRDQSLHINHFYNYHVQENIREVVGNQRSIPNHNQNAQQSSMKCPLDLIRN